MIYKAFCLIYYNILTMGDIVILPGDVHNILDPYEITIYELMRDKKTQDKSIVDVSITKDIMKHKLLDYYGLKVADMPLSSLEQARYNYLVQKSSHSYHKMVQRCTERLRNKETILETMATLKSLILPDQRTKEWYEMRETVLTASSLADALGKGHFNTREGLLIDKSSKIKKPFVMHEIMEWGVKYEQVATMFYESLNKVTILEFGLVPHPTFPIFGASPDGICDTESPPEYIGRMLEIKCPPRRQFTAEVPEHYWMQMQGQLESCNLEECDFLQVKLLEYSDVTSYQEDMLKNTDDEIVDGITSAGLPKGLVLSFKEMIEEQPHFSYEYAPLYMSYETLVEWKTNTIKTYTGTYGEVIECWYKIERYECTLVLRDRDWWLETMPKIIDFWEDVEKYRKEGNQSLIDKRDARKHKRKISIKQKPTTSAKHVIHINKTIQDTMKHTYMLDSSEEET